MISASGAGFLSGAHVHATRTGPDQIAPGDGYQEVPEIYLAVLSKGKRTGVSDWKSAAVIATPFPLTASSFSHQAL